MLEDQADPCSQRELVEAFARGDLEGIRRREAESLLEHSEPCRAVFRRLTAGRYPGVENYTIIGQVGKGGFGVVYKAIHHAKERIEALKVLFSKTPLLTEYFQKEVHFIARLRHPNIATLFDAQLSTPPLYYAMEFVEGEQLNGYLKGHVVSLADRINIIKTVARAVGYAHEQGVVHRDLKPQNVLMDQEGQPHVIDFGIAKKLALVEPQPTTADAPSQERHEGPVGTLGYIAPEQEKGGTVDARADVFALGALLFHCVTGEPARLAKVADQRTRILRERQVVQPEDIGAIIACCVEDSPEKRYATCTDLVADLDNYLTGRPILAREAGSVAYRTYRTVAFVSRNFPITVRVAVLVVVAGLLTLLFWKVETHSGRGQSGGGDQTVMIGLTDDTLDAIDDGEIGADLPGLDPGDMLSLRMLYGKLFERLAQATPKVVVVDSYFPWNSRYDERLVQGLRALRASGIPVIVGAQRFDVDGEPELCSSIRQEVSGYGALTGTSPAKHPSHYEVSYCIQRGYERPIPGLALAAFAAIHYPDCDRRLRLDVDGKRVYMQYRKRGPQGAKARWEEHAPGFPLHRLLPVKASNKALEFLLADRSLEPGDLIGHALVGARPNAYWSSEHRTLSFEQVLSAETQQLKRWVDGRAIVIGKMLGELDRRPRHKSVTEFIFGCQVHAEAIDELLATIQSHRFGRRELATRNVLWCGVAVLVVSLQRRRQWNSVRRVTLVCSVLFAFGLALGGNTGFHGGEEWLVEVLMAITGFLTAGSLTFWAKAVRERQLGLTPSAVTPALEGPTLPSTALAETR